MIATSRFLTEIARSTNSEENIIYRWRKKAIDGMRALGGFAWGSTLRRVSLSEHLSLQKRLRDGEM